jgi:hypothetical protein
LALGGKVSYFTTDDDYPREIRWQRAEDTPTGYGIAIDEVAGKLSIAAKGGLAGQSWVFDEMYAAAATHSIRIQPLLTCILMKGAKTRGSVIGISQADTSSAHGLKGIDAAWREERVSIQAIHQEDTQGNRSPTGRYQVQQGDEVQSWQLPAWMLTERNQRGDIDPIDWVLKHFPELTQATSEQQDIRAKLEGLYRAPGETTGEMDSEIISPQGETGEKVKKPGEMGETPHTARLSGLGETGEIISPQGETDGETGEISPDRVSRVCEMKRAGLNQTQIIAIEWGAKPGKSQAYLDAVEQYKSIIDRFGRAQS